MVKWLLVVQLTDKNKVEHDCRPVNRTCTLLADLLADRRDAYTGVYTSTQYVPLERSKEVGVRRLV